MIDVVLFAAMLGWCFRALYLRDRLRVAEDALRLYAMSDLPDGVYEECGECPPDGGCLKCFDEGVVPHSC